MPWGAIELVARAELRARWRALVALGLLAGVVGAAVVGALVVARRTSSAPTRLQDATSAGDFRAVAYGDPEVAEAVAALPSVTRSWTGSFGVAEVEGEVVRFVGVLAGPARPEGFFTPVLVSGREPDPDDQSEVLLSEGVAEGLGAGPGTELRLTFLTPEEVASFDTGFGEPDGPTLTASVVGVMRLPEAVAQNVPVLATPAFHERYGRAIAAGTGVDGDLARRPGARAELQAEVDRLNESVPRAPGAEEFPVVDLTFTSDGDVASTATARVLVSGLLVAAAVGALAGGLALAQAASRHHAGGATGQEVEAALGLTLGERVAARAVPALLAALLAAALAAGGAVVAGFVEPTGGLRRVEPHPGWRSDLPALLLGAAATAVVVLTTSALTARRAARRRRARPRPAAAVRLARYVGRAPVAVGLGFAFDPGRGARRVPVRSSLAGAIVGVAGVAAVLTFAASVDRLVESPERWGWEADLSIADVTEPITADLLDDPRVGDVSVVDQSPVRIGDTTVSGQTLERRKGEVGWTVLEGRMPRADREVLLGTRVARRLDVGIGGRVDGLRVVGIGLGPSVNNEHLGDLVLLRRPDFERLKLTEPFANALVRAAPGTSGSDLAAALARDLEVSERFQPDEVRNLGELGSLPAALAAFLALLAAAALAHALVVTTRRRAGDLAVLRAVGFTPAQAGGSMVTMALATVAGGVVVGLPLGALVGRLVWWAVARSAGAGTDPSLPIAGFGLLAVALAAGAVLVAAVPAVRAARLHPAALLHTE